VVDAGNFDAYLAAVDLEAQRALVRYGMLVVPGLELTYNDLDPDKAAHAVAVGLRAFVPLETGIFEALRAAREAGAALIAAHPHGPTADMVPLNTTRRFWREWDRFAPHLDRVELFNQANLYSWVAAQQVPAVAGGDFHGLEHLSSWKTLLPCPQTSKPWSTTCAPPRPSTYSPSAPRPPSHAGAPRRLAEEPSRGARPRGCCQRVRFGYRFRAIQVALALPATPKSLSSSGLPRGLARSCSRVSSARARPRSDCGHLVGVGEEDTIETVWAIDAGAVRAGQRRR
jgi:hypothetical protein